MPEGSTGGTLSVMAPELLAGSPPDARSDIWSLGVLLYEMASGRLPFTTATGLALTAAILQQEPTQLPDSVPASVRRAIAACLVKDPAARCQHAGEIRAMLENTTPAAGAATASSRRAAPRLAIAAVLVVLALLAAAAVFYWDGLRGPAGGPIESLAVLPLQNLSGDQDQEYFADGMTEALITELAQIHPLKVISRTSVMQYKDAKQPLPEIGRALNVDAIVEGSIRRSGDRVAISVQLLRASTDASIWAEQAIELNRSYATAYHGYAVLLASWGDRGEEAVGVIRRGLQVDPLSLPVNHMAGLVLSLAGRSDEAIAQFRQTLEMEPGYAMSRGSLAAEYERKGMHAEAFAERQRLKANEGADPALLKRYAEAFDRGGMTAYRELDLKRATENWDGWHASAWGIGVLSAGLGHAELAFDWLDRAVEMRSGMVVWLPTAPEYANLRTHPRYQAALRRIAAPPS